jgi:hypothetical protein
MGIFAFAPLSVDAATSDDARGKHRSEKGHERMMERRYDRATTTEDKKLNKEDRRGLTSMLGDHGKHRGWYQKNPAAETWMKDVLGSIKDSDYSDFKTAASNTPLGTSTTKDIFEKLALASDKIEAGKQAEARTLMKELRDSGYRFKQLFRESLMKLFPKPVK